MYMTYVSGQISLLMDGKPWTNLSADEDSEGFRPTWLVRTSDMQRVPGTDAVDGYCTLSYSWNYSGDLVQGEDGEYECVDNGHHQLIYKPSEGASFFEHEIQHVKFEQLVQQLCKDFEINYIWYDKMCIDQNDKVAKHSEIERMHQIYRSGKFAVAMIPEMSVPEGVKEVSWTSGILNLRHVINDEKFKERNTIENCLHAICDSQWYKRMWTLEEAIMSRQIVFVGRNAHLWLSTRIFFGGMALSAHMGTIEDLFELFLTEPPTANMVLRHAHTRNTAKEHDRAYALANIFADLIEVEVNYDLPILHVLSCFYSNLLEKDLSILCFGKPRSDYNNTICDYYDLPSWTGISGIHIRNKAYTLVENPSDIVTVDRTTDPAKHRLNIINCNYLPVTPRQFPLTKEELSRYMNDGGFKFTHYIDELSSDKPEHEEMRRGMMAREIAPGSDHPLSFLSLTEEDESDCSECIILDIPFKSTDSRSTRIFPVVRLQQDASGADGDTKETPTYRSIGVLYLRCRKYYFQKHASLSDFTDQTQNGSFVIV
ncbi:heterokaryon incompatibility protein-domain-containing protein [Zychaea mexicana]|uniref:heterokaryon incompatibility protein-domain-containing protein n=1 Tax=Zychaea mexicana TaxID=64656 RepID=UPI0022FF4424|nr:heterokaryon incompatibility protein-domain-containing protein [Zychaea mexicana]KAI9488942.1 heterokaryon incompatibility protein-domain-containing protein [Zychaea mexicana]